MKVIGLALWKKNCQSDSNRDPPSAGKSFEIRALLEKRNRV